MLQARTDIDLIEVTGDGTVQIRFSLKILDDDQQIDCKWHRTSIPPGHDPDEQIEAVNNNLLQMGRSPVESARLAELRTIVALAHTEDRVAAYRQKMEDIAREG